ncbi:MAG: T9SS type A sorting domain-containing protein [Crocinitomix sp.]|nr:T9SS type A sorting domain-containing protein [Crocinitomix sp.]
MMKKLNLKQVLLAGFTLCAPLVWGQTEVFDYTGSIETYTVPADVNQIQITTKGASGGEGDNIASGVPGHGASIQGNFIVEPGQVLKILVGEEGEGGAFIAGGGGGSFVWDQSTDELLSAAGGGGGGGQDDMIDTYIDGVDASIDENGTDGAGFDTGGGVDGDGGVTPGVSNYASGGAGWFSNGANGTTYGCDNNSTGGETPLSGGDGGNGGGDDLAAADGGFGGGGGGNGRCGAVGGGGGGGYSGGGAGGEILASNFNGGGGGGSFNGGAFPVELVLGTTGNGQIIISVLCYVINLDADVVDELSGSDGAINLTVTGGTSPYVFDWDTDGTGDFDDDEDLVALTGGTYAVVVQDDAGCTESLDVVVGSSVNVNELEKLALNIYPNPTTDLLTIEFEGSYTYELINVNGDILFTGTAKDKHTLSLEDQASGVYFIKVTSNNITKVNKVVKE